tara:strand:- start:172 stop:903 length:732 start_codon:yes stop_codon:yes gene_type:complete
MALNKTDKINLDYLPPLTPKEKEEVIETQTNRRNRRNAIYVYLNKTNRRNRRNRRNAIYGYLVDDLKYLLPLTPKEKVIEKIMEIHFAPDTDKQETVDKFWNAMLSDLEAYDRQLQDTKPFEHTCYKYCRPRCIKKWDATYWEFKITGFRKRTFVSEYKYPVKLFSVLLVLIAGVFKLLRANQDGKASFYGNLIHVVTNSIVIVIFWFDGERVMLLPKVGAIMVSVAILYGIMKHATDEGVGL